MRVLKGPAHAPFPRLRPPSGDVFRRLGDVTMATGGAEPAGIMATSATRLDLAHALSIAQAAIAAARRSDCLISVAVCNREGRMIAFLKMDGTDALSGHEAIRRAVASAGLGRPSEMVDHLMDGRSRVSTVENEGIGSSHQRGGLPLVRLGVAFGAVGVCGAGDGESDVTCASAAALAFLEAPQDIPLG